MARRILSAAVFTAALLVSSCASGPQHVSVEDDGGGGGLSGGDARGAHRAFILRKQQELRQSSGSEEERRREQLVLAEMTVWMHGQEAASLASTPPEDVYLRLKAARQQREREERERAIAVEAKLEEFFNWALQRWGQSAVRFRSVGREYLMTEPPLRQQTEAALTAAVLDVSEAADTLRQGGRVPFLGVCTGAAGVRMGPGVPGGAYPSHSARSHAPANLREALIRA